MNIEAMAPGVRMALKALGFEPEKIVTLMANIGNGIQNVNEQLAAIHSQNAEIIRRLENLENGRADERTDERTDERIAADDPGGN